MEKKYFLIFALVFFSIPKLIGQVLPTLKDSTQTVYLSNAANKSELESNFSLVDNFVVFPNPATNGFVNITSVSRSPKIVYVYDVLGKLLIKKNLLEIRLDIPSLKSGIYILKITQDGQTETKKLVVR